MTLSKKHWAPYFSMLLLLCSITASAKGGAPKSGPSCGYNVTTLFNDTDYSVNPLVGIPFQLQSDGKGAYTTQTISRSDQVVSQIQGSCSWLLDTTGSTSRGVNLTLAYPQANGLPAPPFTAATVHGIFNDLCGNNPANNGITYGSMTFVGQSLSCGMTLSFNYGGKSYALRTNPLSSSSPGSTWLQVTCTGATSGQCNAWTVVPDPTTGTFDPATGQFSALGELFQPATKGKSEVDMGLYYVALSIVIHK